MFLVQKYTQFKSSHVESQKRRVTEKELNQLNQKIDKLLTRLDEHEPEAASNQDDECVVCVSARATMETSPCGHRVVCRKCFVKTIQMAVAQRMLPLRCVVCRTKILRLKHTEESARGTGQDRGSWYHVPQSSSLYSVSSSNSTSSSTSSSSTSSSLYSYKSSGSSDSSVSSDSSRRVKLSKKNNSKNSSDDRKSGKGRESTHGTSSCSSMESSPQEGQEHGFTTTRFAKGKLSLIQEFRREFSLGKDQRTSAASNAIHPPTQKVSKSNSKNPPKKKCISTNSERANSAAVKTQANLNRNFPPILSQDGSQTVTTGARTR